MATVAARESEVIEQPRNTLIEHGAIVTAGLVAERRGEPALADAGRAADDEVLDRVDPLALEQRREHGAVQAAVGAVVDVLGGGRLLALGTPSELSDASDAYVLELLRTPRRQAERINTLLPGAGAA